MSIDSGYTTTIASGQTVSAVVDFRRRSLVGIILPAAMTGTTMTFQVSNDNVTYVSLAAPAGGDVSITIAASKMVYLDPIIFHGVRYLKLVSGSAEGAERTIGLVGR